VPMHCDGFKLKKYIPMIWKYHMPLCLENVITTILDVIFIALKLYKLLPHKSDKIISLGSYCACYFIKLKLSWTDGYDQILILPPSRYMSIIKSSKK
jgi:hypothetical protein